MDDFINAHVHLGCRRVVTVLYFDNDKTRESRCLSFQHYVTFNGRFLLATNFHLLCDPTSPLGCNRCRPKKFAICCDLCNPDSFSYLDFPSPATKPRGPQKSTIKNFTMTSVNRELKTALFEWRARAAPLKFPHALVHDFGAKILLSNDIIDCIVMCAQAGKLSSTADLSKETKWKKELVSEFGESLLAIVRIHHPIDPPPKTPTEAVPSTRKTAGLVKCSACGNTGHNSKSINTPEYFSLKCEISIHTSEANRNCPKRIEHRQMFEKADAENVNPQRNNPPPSSQPAVTRQCASPAKSLAPSANQTSDIPIHPHPQQYLQPDALVYPSHPPYYLTSHYHFYQHV